MSAPIGKGDWVECVDASPGARTGRVTLTIGALYQVRRVGPTRGIDGAVTPGVLLHGIVVPWPSPSGELWFGLERFRPIYRPKADFIESLKAPPRKASSRKKVEA